MQVLRLLSFAFHLQRIARLFIVLLHPDIYWYYPTCYLDEFCALLTNIDYSSKIIALVILFRYLSIAIHSYMAYACHPILPPTSPVHTHPLTSKMNCHSLNKLPVSYLNCLLNFIPRLCLSESHLSGKAQPNWPISCALNQEQYFPLYSLYPCLL